MASLSFTLHFTIVIISPILTTFTSSFLIRLPYRSAIILGKDYPHPEGIDYVRRKWKDALRDPENCKLIEVTSPDIAKENERIIRKAVGRGRHVSSCRSDGISLQQMMLCILFVPLYYAYLMNY